MGSLGIGMLLVGSALGQAQGNGTDYEAITASARELARQLEFLQRSFANIPGPPEGRGLYQQSELIQYDLIYFRQQLKRKVAREDLYLAFDKVDGKVNTLLGDIQGFTNWVPSVKMTSRAVASALHDLHFALSSGDGAPVRQSQAAYRQTLAALAKIDDLKNMVGFVFDEQDVLKPWMAGFADLRRDMVALQKLQQNKKAAPADLKAQMVQADKAWDKLVGKFKELPEDQHLILRLDFGRVDQVFARLDAMFGIPSRRPNLPADFVP